METLPSITEQKSAQMPICCGYDVPSGELTEEQRAHFDRIQDLLLKRGDTGEWNVPHA